MKATVSQKNIWDILLKKSTNELFGVSKKVLELKGDLAELQNRASYLKTITDEAKRRGDTVIKETSSEMVMRQSYLNKLMELYAANQARLSFVCAELEAAELEVGRLANRCERYKRLEKRQRAVRLDRENQANQKDIDRLALMAQRTSGSAACPSTQNRGVGL